MASDVSVPLSDGGALTAALAVPDGPGPHPGVVVLHEAYGLNDDIRAIAERFAGNGYVAVAPDLYSSGGNRWVCLVRTFLGADAAVDRIEVVRRWLATRPDVDGERLAVIGFCMGGGFALLLGARGGVKAAGVNYGRVPKDRTKLDGVCPVVASYGAADRVMKDDGRRLERHLTELGVAHDVRFYDGVGHSFMNTHREPALLRVLPNPMHSGHSAPEAEDAWQRVFAFFGEHVRS